MLSDSPAYGSAVEKVELLKECGVLKNHDGETVKSVLSKTMSKIKIYQFNISLYYL